MIGYRKVIVHVEIIGFELTLRETLASSTTVLKAGHVYAIKIKQIKVIVVLV